MIRKVRICVCGGRKYSDYLTVKSVLDSFLLISDNFVIISGGANGADSLAIKWAIENNIEYEEYKANWKAYRKKAGPIRNRLMLSTGIDILIAFPGGNGTRDMINICENSNVIIKRII